MSHIWYSIMTDGNTQWVLLSTLLLGMASGVLGSFALLRKQSLIGDAVAHAALPGICFAFMFTGERDFLFLLIGATATGLLAAYTIQFIRNTTRIKEDTAICLVLSVFFGLGIVLLTKVTKMASGNKSGLDDYIFGQAAALVGTDVKIMGITATSLIIVTALLFKELKVSTFDPQFAKGIGLPVGFLNLLFSSLLVLTVVVGIQAVGVILMAALLITPAIAARYWTDSLRVMVVISGIIGGVSGAIGTIISTLGKGLPTGPFIVVAATIVFLFSMLFAPSRGLLAIWIRRKANDHRIAARATLKKLYKLAEQGETQIKEQQLDTKHLMAQSRYQKIIREISKKGFVTFNNNHIILTDKGKQRAEEYIFVDELVELKEMYPSELSSLNLDYIEESRKEGLSKEQFQALKRMLNQVYQQHPFLTRRGGTSYEL
ncbi:metal ABC transporter permease [Bacillus pinisoli]|uniref:metal ABC transporter permease n=1 Tax=Bacillus pinisoli TaxID=2901866 RepID=UPI001FF68566|nr:metal ABC transporter permease [Bacillus pinisoli]